MGKTKKKKKKQNIPHNARSNAGERAQSNSIYVYGDNNTIQNVQQGNVRNSNSTQTIPDTKKIREKLKDAYEKLRLPMVSWMQRGSGNFLVGHHFIQLQLHEGNETSTTKHGEEMELRNIFEGRIPDGTTDSQILSGDFERRPRPNRILIESQPGFGKTTLAHKIIHDWAEDKEYACHFELAILITLRSLKTKTTTKSIEGLVREKTKTTTSDGCNQWEIINNDKTLLVLDGLDEVDYQCKENVLKILYDTFDYKMVIVVTCRTGLFNLDEEFVDCVHGGAKKGNQFWDKKLRIVGITTENRLNFVSTFIEEESKQQLLDRIENIINQFSGSSHSENINGMFKSPLFLILLVFVVERNCQVTIKTNTELFKNLMDCLIRRCVAKTQKNQTPLKPNFTIFVEHSDDSVSMDYLELFDRFGNMALERILNGDLHFECNIDTDQIYEMGFFIKHEQQEKKELLQHYECFHLSILEFSAAFSIWRNFLSSGKIDKDKINVVCKEKGATSLVIPFLFGLMGKDGKELLSQLSDCNLLYNTKKALMELVFTECDMDDDWRDVDVVTTFVPSELKFPIDSLFVITPVLNKCLVKLCMSSRDVRHLSQSLGIQFLELEVDTWENLNPNVIDRIKCEHLLLKFSSSLQLYDDSNFGNLKKIVSISAHSREVLVNNDVQKDILQYINSQIFDNVVLDEFVVDTLCVPTSEFAQQLIASITKHVTANHLFILFKYGADADVLEYCSSVICKSSNIRSISLVNECYLKYNYRINFDLITDNGRKKWTSLILNNFYVERTVDHSCCVDIENFISKGDSDVLEQVAPRRLGCTDELLRSVANDSHWGGLESVVELTLIFGDKFAVTKIPNLSYLRRFNRLTSVTLYVRHIETLFSTSLIGVGRELNYRRKIRIFITIHLERHLVTLLDYIKDVIKNEEFNSSQRVVLLIDFNVADRNAHLDTAKSLTEITATAPNIRFKFFFVENKCVDLFLAQNIVDYSACSVAYKIYPLYSRWKYLNYYFFVHVSFRLHEHTLRILSVRKR